MTATAAILFIALVMEQFSLGRFSTACLFYTLGNAERSSLY
jgi:hypothetical protein